MTGKHASGPQGEFGAWGNEKVHFWMKHDPGFQEVLPSEPVTMAGDPGMLVSMLGPCFSDGFFSVFLKVS